MNSADPIKNEVNTPNRGNRVGASEGALPARESKEGGARAVYLSLKEISFDGGTQARVEINLATVTEYADALSEGESLPPPVVFFDGSEYHLADGFHRYRAYNTLGATSMECEVRTGTLLDARMFAYGANKGHGLPRTSADKRKAVMGALADAPDWSDRAIATHVGVSPSTVGACRPSLSNLDSEPAERTYTTKHGATATMNVAGQKAAGKERARARQADEPTLLPMGDAAHKPPADEYEDMAEDEALPPAEAAPAANAADSQLKALCEALEAEGAAHRETLAENDAMLAVFEADDKLAAAVASNKQLRAEVSVLRERVNGLLGEKSQAVRLVKYWKRKAGAAE